MASTLFERLGGIDAITAVVEDFRDRVAGDDRINLKFARTDLARLRKMLIDQVCEATGGPCHYNGRSMKEAHAGMKVTKGEFNALVEDLVATLKQFKVPSAEQDELLAILGPLISTWLPTQAANIAVKEEGETITVAVANAGEVQSRLLRDGQGTGFQLRGGGFVAALGLEVADLAPSASRWSDPDLRQFETKSGARGDFTWSG